MDEEDLAGGGKSKSHSFFGSPPLLILTSGGFLFRRKAAKREILLCDFEGCGKIFSNRQYLNVRATVALKSTSYAPGHAAELGTSVPPTPSLFWGHQELW